MSDDDKFEETSRDILVELRSDMKHVRGAVDHLKASDGKQWERLDEHGRKLSSHDRSVDTLTWGFRLLAGGALTVVTGVVVYAVTHIR